MATNNTNTTIKRRAIDSNGMIGPFYDIYRNRVLERSHAIERPPVKQILGEITCKLIDGKTDGSRNILEWINIDDDLRLNILLNTAPRTGVAKLAEYYHPMGEYTRFLHFLCLDREYGLSHNYEGFKSIVREVDATHIITSISLGIDVVVVLQLPVKGKIIQNIDFTLRKVCTRLNDPLNDSCFSRDDADVLKSITEIKVYSNIPELVAMTSFLEVCQYIDKCKHQHNPFQPTEYTLQPIEQFTGNTDKSHGLYTPLSQRDSGKLEKYLIEMLNYYNKIKYLFECCKNKGLHNNLQQSLADIEIEWRDLRQCYQNKMKELGKLIASIRAGHNNASEIGQALQHNDQTMFKQKLQEISKKIKVLYDKMQPIHRTQKGHDTHAALFDAPEKQDDQELKSNLQVTPEKQPRSMNRFNNDNKLDGNQSQLIIEQNNKSNELALSSHSKTHASDSSTASTTAELINILLLGESGVGKSTFINAFVNYLTFGTLEKAQQGKPVVLIPVSFLLTTGDNFEERTVTFGDVDSLNNENFDHPGQSVTQHCKSYVFQLDNIRQKKICIIDTPGFGDTRGLDQDDVNMQHILEYINDLTHINAVCFLLKPNASRVHNFFKTCLARLLNSLGSTSRQNIIFCFTNARSTFYSPGDAAPLLKSVLKGTGFDDIPFKKENTFCFDNESFRYLTALQNKITFSTDEHSEYKHSWLTSVKESSNFLNYVCTKLKVHTMRVEPQSTEKAQLQIKQMIRPMLEAIRNILRNCIIWDMSTTEKSIELKPIPLFRSTLVCYQCKRDVVRTGGFWMTIDAPHEIQKTCNQCRCAPDQRIEIDYELTYAYVARYPNSNRADEMARLERLLRASAQFTYFLINIARSSKDDPFFMGIVQMISEENDLCQSRNPNEFNLELVKRLRQHMSSYEEYVNSIKPNHDGIKLGNMYKSVQTIHEDPIVRVQMDAVKKTRHNIMKQYTCEFSNLSAS
ncbi:unnamed protein product [Rotaria socialis]|uniref:G domain-containing protein n=1 Tax=Rotaria socialis TaxID=392032 RepID=A0A820Y738_9BILA|nr:unnamed protein product [Rotaria socialis]CAF4541740.1 unnamed protein product [Rotaria socialis]